MRFELDLRTLLIWIACSLVGWLAVFLLYVVVAEVIK